VWKINKTLQWTKQIEQKSEELIATAFNSTQTTPFIASPLSAQ